MGTNRELFDVSDAKAEIEQIQPKTLFGLLTAAANKKRSDPVAEKIRLQVYVVEISSVLNHLPNEEVAKKIIKNVKEDTVKAWLALEDSFRQFPIFDQVGMQAVNLKGFFGLLREELGLKQDDQKQIVMQKRAALELRIKELEEQVAAKNEEIRREEEQLQKDRSLLSGTDEVKQHTESAPRFVDMIDNDDFEQGVYEDDISDVNTQLLFDKDDIEEQDFIRDAELKYGAKRKSISSASIKQKNSIEENVPEKQNLNQTPIENLMAEFKKADEEIAKRQRQEQEIKLFELLHNEVIQKMVPAGIVTAQIKAQIQYIAKQFEEKSEEQIKDGLAGFEIMHGLDVDTINDWLKIRRIQDNSILSKVLNEKIQEFNEIRTLIQVCQAVKQDSAQLIANHIENMIGKEKFKAIVQRPAFIKQIALAAATLVSPDAEDLLVGEKAIIARANALLSPETIDSLKKAGLDLIDLLGRNTSNPTRDHKSFRGNVIKYKTLNRLQMMVGEGGWYQLKDSQQRLAEFYQKLKEYPAIESEVHRLLMPRAEIVKEQEYKQAIQLLINEVAKLKSDFHITDNELKAGSRGDTPRDQAIKRVNKAWHCLQHFEEKWDVRNQYARKLTYLDFHVRLKDIETSAPLPPSPKSAEQRKPKLFAFFSREKPQSESLSQFISRMEDGRESEKKSGHKQGNKH